MIFFASSSNQFYESLSTFVNNQGSGKFPQSSSELLLIRPQGFSDYEWERENEETYENLTVGTKINLTLKGASYSEIPFNFPNQSAEIVGVIEYNREYAYRTSPFEGDLTNIFKQYLTPSLPWEKYYIPGR